MARAQSPESALARLQWSSATVGLVGAALSIVGWLLDAQQFFQAYLVGYTFWWGITMGCLALTMLFHMVGGAWGYVSRPFFESGASTLPLVALLFVPLGFGLEQIYDWTRSGFFAGGPHTHNRELYLSKTSFLARAAFYFASWLVLQLLLTRATERRQRSGQPLRSAGLGRLSGGGMVFLVLTVSFAGIDWLMSLDPHFYSTIYGGIVAISGLLAGMSMVVASVALVLRWPSHPEVGPAQLLNDLGNLLLAFVMLWTYFQLSQYLIIWSGNLPEEAAWYVSRSRDGWQGVTLALFVLHFGIPFACLLSRDVKRNPRRLAAVAIVLLVMHYADVFWLVVPALHESRLVVHWLHATVPIALGGFWLAAYAWHLKRRLLPVYGELAGPDDANRNGKNHHG